MNDISPSKNNPVDNNLFILKMKKILLIDAHSLIHRSFHALPPLTAPDGLPTGALYGVANTLLKVLKEKKPDYVVAAFDRPEPTFRKEQFEAYKAHRPKAPDELISQIKESRELFKKLGIFISEIPGYEGDDIIGTFSEKFSKESGVFITILTGDLDTLQLVKDGKIEVETFKKGINDIAIYDEAGVQARFGVPPEHIIDYKGLVGDQSDNIPGIPGVGPKTAIQFISEYGTIENIYKEVTEKHPLYKKIGGHKDSAFLSKKLATIEKHIPIHTTLDETLYIPPDENELKTYFRRLGFESLIKRMGWKENESPTTPKNNAGEKEMITNDGILITYEWKDALKGTKNKKVSPEKVFDIKIAAWLLDPDKKDLSESAIAKRFLGSDGNEWGKEKLYAVLREEIKKNKLERVFREIEMPLIPVLADMETTGILGDEKIFLKLQKEIRTETEKIEKEVFEMAGEEFNLSSPHQVSEVLFTKLQIKNGKRKKTKTGMSSTAESVLAELRGQHPIIEKVLTHRENTKILSTYVSPLLERVRISQNHRIHTTYLQTGTATGRLSSEKPNLQNIPQESKWSKELRSAFVAEDGFSLVSFDYSQLELRLLAHISGDEKLKSAFWNKKDIHNITASQIFNIDESGVTPDLRRIAKTLNFGVAYGMGARAFSATSNLSLEDARKFINEYYLDFPKVKEWQEKTKKEAREEGIIKNETGRIRVFPRGMKNEWLISEMERAAINMPVQGLGADIIKLAMIGARNFIDKEQKGVSTRLILTIHDELIFEVRDDILKNIVPELKKIMETCIPLSVPLIVDINVGKNWGNLKKYEE